MANTFKNACLAVGTSRTDIYTCPSSTAAVIHSVYLSNIDGTNNATVTIELYDSSATTHFSLGTTLPVDADSTLVLDKPINLEAADKLVVTASAASDIVAVCAVLEIT